MVPIVALLLGLVVLIVVEALPHDTIGAVFAACLRGMALILLLGSSVLFLTRRKREMKRIALGQAQGPAGRPWAIGAIVAAFAAIWLIAGTASQAKVLAHRLSALARMQIIGRAMVTSAQRDGWFPQSLDLLVEEGHLPATALNCSARSSAGDEESACIEYVEGQSLLDDPDNVLVYEARPRSGGEHGVLLVNGTAHRVRAQDLEGLLARTGTRMRAKRRQWIVDWVTVVLHDLNVGNAIQAFDQTAGHFSSDDAILADCVREVLQNMEKTVTEYEDAATRVRDAGTIKPTTLPTRASVAERIRMYRDWQAANSRVRGAVVDFPQQVCERLKARDFGRSELENVRKTLRRLSRSGPLLPYLLEEAKLNDAFVGMLEFLGSHWGGWSLDPVTNKVAFADPGRKQEFSEVAAGLAQPAQELARLRARPMPLPPTSLP